MNNFKSGQKCVKYFFMGFKGKVFGYRKEVEKYDDLKIFVVF